MHADGASVSPRNSYIDTSVQNGDHQPGAGSMARGGGQVRTTRQVQGLDIPTRHPPRILWPCLVYEVPISTVNFGALRGGSTDSYVSGWDYLEA